MKRILFPIILASLASNVFANTPPTPQVVSAAMRDGTTILDIVYRVDDPDDATVKVRALAFVDGVRSFANVLRPVTFVDGTASNLGDSVPTGTDLSLAWDVGADWDIDLGEVKFEILARDGRGLLPFDWITIPAAEGEPELTISKDTPTDAAVLDALFWQYADGDAGLTLAAGVLSGNSSSGVFDGFELVSDTAVKTYAAAYIFKQMNLAPSSRVAHAVAARSGIQSQNGWHATNSPWSGISPIVAWPNGSQGLLTPPEGLSHVTAIAAGHDHSLAVLSDGTVVGWGSNNYGQTMPPAGLSGVVAIAAGYRYSLALRSNGTVVGWGLDSSGQATPPAGLSGVVAVAAGQSHSLALLDDGTVVGWGYNGDGEATPPSGLSGMTAISAGVRYSLAVRSDGTVIGWGYNLLGLDQRIPPAGLSGVVAVAAGELHSLALRSNGTVVGWGHNNYGQATPPGGLSGVTAIAVGYQHSLALRSDGTVVLWGYDQNGNLVPPPGLNGVTAIASGTGRILALKPMEL